jgi:hypothetical protein
VASDSSYAPNASSSIVIGSSNGRRKDLVPSREAFILHVTPVVGVFGNTGARTMEIVGIVMLSAVALYFVQQFQPGV